MLVILSLQGVDEKLREYAGLIFEEFLQAAHVPCNCISNANILAIEKELRLVGYRDARVYTCSL